MNKFFKLENDLKNSLLRHVSFEIGDKKIKEGKVKVFNTKQFFINFELENDGEVKEFRVTYPYSYKVTDKGIMFDYCLSAFCPRTEEVYWKMKATNSSSSSKYHEEYLWLLFD